jgi:hypothetical protein
MDAKRRIPIISFLDYIREKCMGRQELGEAHCYD